jgi:hypothetical protein
MRNRYLRIKCQILIIIVGPLLIANQSWSNITATHNVLPQSGLQYYCDKITWIDGSGQPRTAYLATDTVHPVGKFRGGHMQQFFYMNGSAQKMCYSFSSAGFGSTINHGNMPGSCSVAWLASGCDAYDDTSKFIFLGAHHAIWQYRNKLALHGAGHPPYLIETRQYIFCDGADQIQYAISFDASMLPVDTVEPFWDARTPYNDFNWWGDPNVYPKNMYGVGTAYCGLVNTGAMTFDVTTPYNLCPYVTAWYSDGGFDDEIGIVQTRLNTKHWAGRNAGNTGKSGALNGVDCFDYQLSDYQGWTGGRICYQADKPNGVNQWPGVTFGTENYSLSMLIGKHSAGGSDKLISEANAIQNGATKLTATTGAVRTRGIEGVGLPLTRDWDKPGFDQVYRTFNFIASNNIAEGTLVVQPGQSLKNPTFVIENYTANANPEVYLNTIRQNDGSGCWISIDTAAHRAWVTFNAAFSGSQNVRFAGPADQVDMAVSHITISPSMFLLGTNTTVTVGATVSGAVSKVALDAQALGGGIAVMSGSNGTYSYSVNAPGTITEGARRLIVRAYDSQNQWREADTFVMIKRPELPIYTDGSGAKISTWTGGGMTVAEKSGGAPEGTKYAEFTFAGGNGAHGGIDFNAPADFRPYRYLVMSYKGPTTGRFIEFTIGSGNTWPTNRYKLPAVNNWTTVALPMYAVTGGSAMEKKTANSIHFWLDTTGGSGTFDFDNFYATSLPDAIPVFTAAILPKFLQKNQIAAPPQIRHFNRALIYSLPPSSALTLFDLQGRCVHKVVSHERALKGTLTPARAGLYVINVTGSGNTLTQTAVFR